MSRGMKRVAALVVCLVCLQCGSDSPTGPTTPPGPSLPPGPVEPPTQPPPIPPTSSPVVFVGAGDIGWCGSAGLEATGRLLDGIGGTIFTLGDNAYPSGSAQNFRDCYDPAWGRYKGRTFPVPGNHEYEQSGAAPYFAYFGGQAGTPGVGYYSLPLGAWHAIALNSNVAVGASSPQGQWLRADLTMFPAKCTLAYWHHPLFTSGQNGPSEEMRDFWRILYEFNADLVLAGHDHLYERFGPQDPDGRPDPARGIREFVVGTGGAPSYPFRSIRPNSEKQLTPVFGVLKLTLHSESYQWEFVTASGVGDSGTGQCH
jgi:hypothetical protein